MLLGCIADDITGATDLALMLSRSGMRTIQVMGVPDDPAPLEGFDAVVVALKSRTNAVDEAVAWSLASADVLLAAGARQLFFKYCSTFDSTPRGNIGPVADALLAKLKTDMAIVCPAFPANGRAIYKGHLFVGDQLLSDSPMKDHPLTPMRDANLVAVMAAQSVHAVGLVDYATVMAGADAVREMLQTLARGNKRYAVVDAIENAHLMTIAQAIADHALITGGSGVAMGLADNFVAQGLMTKTEPPTSMLAPGGRQAIIAGSCSTATRGQIAAAIADGIPALRLNPFDLASKAQTADGLLDWAVAQPADRPVLIYSSDEPGAVLQIQKALGPAEAGNMVEHALSTLTAGLADAGFTRFIVAGGETSGAVADALGVAAIEIGPEIDPGVPWVKSIDARGLTLAFKSGNFGAQDFFLKAWSHLTDETAAGPS